MATLFLICGTAGADKTTLAKQLEIAHRAIRFSPDEWIDKIIENTADKIELNRLRDPVESLEWITARRVLRLGVNVILENGFWSKRERMTFQERARDLGMRVELHYLNAPTDELRRRIENRNADLPPGLSGLPLRRWNRG